MASFKKLYWAVDTLTNQWIDAIDPSIILKYVEWSNDKGDYHSEGLEYDHDSVHIIYYVSVTLYPFFFGN